MKTLKKHSNIPKVIIISIIVFISFFYVAKISIDNNRAKTRDRVINGFAKNDFNSNKIISYNDFSKEMKRYITKDQFNNIDSWDKAQLLFNKHYQLIRNNTKKENEYGFKYDTVYYKNGKKYNVAYEISFVNTILNMKINWIVLIIDK